MSIIRMFHQHLMNKPNERVYTFLDENGNEKNSLTYAQLHKKSLVIGEYLSEHVESGCCILLAFQPGLGFIEAFLGALYAGLVPVPILPPVSKKADWSHIKNIVIDAQITAVLSQSKDFSRWEDKISDYVILQNLEQVMIDELFYEKESSFSPSTFKKEDLAFIQYTSGSMGKPKGVMVTHANLLHNLKFIANKFGHTEDSIGVIWLPSYHDMGLIGGILEPLYCGFPVYLMSPLAFVKKPFLWLKAISNYQATTSGGPSFAYDLCVKKVSDDELASLDLSCWEVAFNGAEPVRSDILDNFHEKFSKCGFNKHAFYPCYGMAESTLMVTGGDKLNMPQLFNVDKRLLQQGKIEIATSQDYQTLVGCGKASDDTEILIIDPENGEVVNSGFVGEILVRGPSVASGYFNNTALTEKTFGTKKNKLPREGFLRTGDLGAWIESELVITGRIGDRIVLRGKNYYPQDIELVSESSHPSLNSMKGAAFSITKNDEEVLILLQEVQRSSLRTINVLDVKNTIRESVISNFGVSPDVIALMKPYSIPVTSSHKVRRGYCKKLWLSSEMVGEI